MNLLKYSLLFLCSTIGCLAQMTLNDITLQGNLIVPVVITPAGFTNYASTFNASQSLYQGVGTIVNSKQALISAWLKPSGVDYITLFGSDQNSYQIYRNPDGTIYILLRNSSPADIMLATTSLALTNGAWNHFLFTCDLTDTGKRFVYINDTLDSGVTWTTYANDTINWNAIAHSVAANTGAGYAWVGCLSEIYLATTYLDVSVESNRRKFIGADGKQVNLGATGQTPTGSQPAIYLHNPYGTFGNNLGYLGNYTVTGSLTDCTTP